MAVEVASLTVSLSVMTIIMSIGLVTFAHNKRNVDAAFFGEMKIATH